jgi:hypothetical protein
MEPVHKKILIGGSLGLAAIAAVAIAATPQDARKAGRETPPGWSYKIDKDGKRIPRIERKINEDGSWTEEYKDGNCTVTRTGRDGEVRETRKC